MKPLFVADDSVSAFVRVGMAHAELTRRGLPTTLKEYKTLPIKDLFNYDQVIFQRPTADLRQPFQMLRMSGARIVVDMDDDFVSIPADHPGFTILGRGNPKAIENLYWSISNCDLLTVSTPELARRFYPFAKAIQIIPNYWEDTNPTWTTPLVKDLREGQYLTVGWAGSMTHQKDIPMLIPALVRLAKETPNLRIIIGADLAAYDLLGKVPELQKAYLPGLPFAEYPFIVRQFDILLAPVQDTFFNNAKSDVKLIEAGAAQIPYVASSIIPYRESPNKGGLLVNPDGWYSALRSLILNPDTRTGLGLAGYFAAHDRRISRMTEWEVIIRQNNTNHHSSPIKHAQTMS